MKNKFKHILKDKFVRFSLILSVVFLIPLVTIIIISYSNLPPYIPFYNSMPWGEERLAHSSVTIVLPILIVSIFAINLTQVIFSYKKFVLVSRIIMFNTFLFLLLGLLAYLQILFLTF